MFKKQRRRIEVVVDVIGEILAFATFLFLIFMLIHGKWEIIKDPYTVKVLTYILFAAIVATIGLKGLEFALKRSLILTIIFLVLLIATAVFLFLPDFLPGWLGLNSPIENPFADGEGARVLLSAIC